MTSSHIKTENRDSKRDEKDPVKGPAASLRFKHILVITYGRSGSTLLQGVLNSIDNVVLRGENGNIFYDLFKAYQKLIDLKTARSQAVEPRRPWYGICLIDEDELMARFRDLAKAILLPDQRDDSPELTYGFKEIRYDEVGDDLFAYLDFLTQLFPNTALVFNTRKIEDVAASGWWKDRDKAQVIEQLRSLEDQFRSYAGGKDYCYFIEYEDVIRQGIQLQNLFQFLGGEYRPLAVREVLNTPHSYNPQQEHIQKMFEDQKTRKTNRTGNKKRPPAG